MKSQVKFPNLFAGAVFGICVLPFLLNLLGFDFASRKMSFKFDAIQDLLPHETTDYMFYALSGSFTHTILEWSAFCVAIMTVALSFTHFNIKRDATAPIIGVALFCAGCMDAFHTLAADRLINAVADNKNLIPFTWAICRSFNALILVVGIGILMAKGHKRASLRFIIGVSVFFGLLAYVIIHYCATQAQLPETMFPDSIITRPWDVGPLAIFIFAGIWVFPRFYRWESTLFTQALFISLIPQIITQLHMAFGSTALFDNDFNIAHFIKIMAYVVPFAGLLLEYVSTYHAEQKLVENLKIIQKDLVKSETEIRLLVENVLDPIITIDEKGMIRKFNPAAEKLFLWREKDILGKNVNVLTPEPYKSEHDQYIKRYLETGVARIIGIGREVEGLRKDGTTFPMQLGINEMFVGEQRIFIGILRDITKQKQAEEALKNLSYKDGLTEIFNRRAFDETMEKEWKRAKRNNAAISIIMMDIDYFKKYNDTYGHLMGDKCLRLVAEALNKTLSRSGDIVARYGGEEFVAILPGTDLEGAARVAENFRANVEGLGVEHKNNLSGPNVTISLGVAAAQKVENLTIEKIVGGADKSLYEAKRMGRNCISSRLIGGNKGQDK